MRLPAWRNAKCSSHRVRSAPVLRFLHFHLTKHFGMPEIDRCTGRQCMKESVSSCVIICSLERDVWFVWHGILFEEPNPTGSRPSDLIGLYKATHETPPPQHTRKGKETARRQARPPGGSREPLGRGREKKEKKNRNGRGEEEGGVGQKYREATQTSRV